MNLIIKWHQYLALVVIAPLLIWLGTGLTLNLMDHSAASGNDHKVNLNQQQVFVQGELKPVNFTQITTKPILKIELIQLLSKPYYLLHHQLTAHNYFKSDKTLVNALTGNKINIDQQFAIALAQRSYSGEAPPMTAQLLKSQVADLNKEQNWVWQVNFNDLNNTAVYIRANSGEIIAHVNDNKRFKNLMLRLHFMDFSNVGSFNNWQNILFALLLFLLSVTGIIWFIKLVTKT